MSEAKTRPTTASVAEFLAQIPDAQRRSDCQQLQHMMEEASGSAATRVDSRGDESGAYD